MTRCRPVMSGRGAFAAVLVSFGLVACVSDVPPPTAQMGASSQAILNAERAGAAQYAPVELQAARTKMAAADAAMRADNRIEARRLAEAAQADANYAAAKAQNTAAQQAATTVRRDLQSLRQGTPEPFGAGSTYPNAVTAAPPVAAPPVADYPSGTAGGSTTVTTTAPATPPGYGGPTSWSAEGIRSGGSTTTTTTTTGPMPLWTPDSTTSIGAGKSVSVGVPR